MIFPRIVLWRFCNHLLPLVDRERLNEISPIKSTWFPRELRPESGDPDFPCILHCSLRWRKHNSILDVLERSPKLGLPHFWKMFWYDELIIPLGSLRRSLLPISCLLNPALSLLGSWPLGEMGDSSMEREAGAYMAAGSGPSTQAPVLLLSIVGWISCHCHSGCQSLDAFKTSPLDTSGSISRSSS